MTLNIYYRVFLITIVKVFYTNLKVFTWTQPILKLFHTVFNRQGKIFQFVLFVTSSSQIKKKSMKTNIQNQHSKQ